jgi:hypothetical protein
MPDTFVREMVADMMGASMAYTGSWNMTDWLSHNFERHIALMHPDSVAYLRKVLASRGYNYEEKSD